MQAFSGRLLGLLDLNWCNDIRLPRLQDSGGHTPATVGAAHSLACTADDRCSVCHCTC